jgi:hypothetical protein
MRRINRSHRVRHSRAGAAVAAILDCARFWLFFSRFRAASIVAPWSDQDSVAERIAPLLLMLTLSV